MSFGRWILVLASFVIALAGCSEPQGPQKVQQGDYDGPPSGAKQSK
jgi:uncharacterized lipoprotein